MEKEFELKMWRTDEQTFRQTMRADGCGVITRGMVAEALERIAADLRAPFSGNPSYDSEPGSPLEPYRRLEIHGDVHMGEFPETLRICLHMRKE